MNKRAIAQFERTQEEIAAICGACAALTSCSACPWGIDYHDPEDNNIDVATIEHYVIKNNGYDGTGRDNVDISKCWKDA